jgi:TonB family protein
MLSHSISLGNNGSDLQFIGDLISVCKRHNISCGTPQDAEHLASDLLFNDDFRADLFTLCTAIGHMAPSELSPEQLLALVARAFGGPGLSPGKATVDIPPDASSAFLNGYSKWSRGEPDPVANQPWPIDRNQASVSPQPRTSPYYAAASRSGSDFLGPQEVPSTSHSANPPPSHLFIPPNTILESLTLSELKTYLREIESRMSRIEPHLEQKAPQKTSQPYFSDDYFQRLESLDAQRALRAKATAVREEATLAPLSMIPAAPSIPAAVSEPTAVIKPVVPIAEMPAPLPVIAPAPLIFPYQTVIVPDPPALKVVPDSAPDAARVRYLRTVNAILAFFLFFASVSAIIFAYRYLHPAPTFDETLNRYPVHLGEPSANADGTAFQSSFVPPDATATPTLVPDSANAAPAQAHDTHFAHPASAKFGSNTHSVHQVLTSSSMDRPSYIVPLTPEAPIPTPANATVSVPPSTMMTYAISTPNPIYPHMSENEHDTTVELETTISKEGKVIGVRALSGNLNMREAAIQAVQGWRFRPFMFNGNPVPVVTTFKFVFKAK